MTSDVMGSGPGVTPPVTIDIGVSGRVVVRGLPRPGSVLDGWPGVGSGPGSVMRTGLRPSTGVVDVWSTSM